MRKLSFFYLILILLLSGTLKAQNKFALVVGINDYFDAPGVKSRHSLHGCVNDGRSMQRLLNDRYGFPAENIFTLFDGQATKTNMLYKIRTILLKCKPGDVFVFYYSGHGVWMKNSANFKDTIKNGMSQAIVLSDLYAEGRSFLFRDEQIKEVMNKFIDRQVIPTAIFDCCYSENLAAMDIFDLFYGDEGGGREKDLYEADLPPLIPYLQEPVPCENGADTTDSDKDGVPDCRDWEKNTSSRAYVDQRGVNQDPNLSIYELPDPAFDTFNLTGEKAFDLKQTLSINERSMVPRPTDIKGSRFLGLTATDQYNKGLEIADLAGERHGAFTAALIDVLANEPKDLPLIPLMNKLNEKMDQQNYWQGPRYRFEGDRDKLNLVGLPPSTEVIKLKASCIGKDKERIILNKGTLDGVRNGNTFSLVRAGQKISLKITKVSADSSWASGGLAAIKTGDVFERTDAYAISNPKVKVFIPSSTITIPELDKLIKTTIAPIAKKPNYVANSSGMMDALFFITDVKNYDARWRKDSLNRFTLLLPIPAVMAGKFRSQLQKDQNVELVTDRSKAEMILLMTYSDELGFVLSFNKPEVLESGDNLMNFQPLYNNVKGRSLTAPVLNEIYGSFSILVKQYLRRKTTAWLNLHPKR